MRWRRHGYPSARVAVSDCRILRLDWRGSWADDHATHTAGVVHPLYHRVADERGLPAGVVSAAVSQGLQCSVFLSCISRCGRFRAVIVIPTFTRLLEVKRSEIVASGLQNFPCLWWGAADLALTCPPGLSQDAKCVPIDAAADICLRGVSYLDECAVKSHQCQDTRANGTMQVTATTRHFKVEQCHQEG